MQTDLFISQEPKPECKLPDDGQRLRAHLALHKAFRTRKQICENFGWTERHLRDVAEQLGADVIRCQAGFKLTSDFSREDTTLVLQSVEAFISQGKRMIRYGMALRKRFHSIIG